MLQSGNLGINVSMADRSLPVAFVLTVGNQAGLDVAAVASSCCSTSRRRPASASTWRACATRRCSPPPPTRALERGIPIAVVKSGASEVGAQVTATHTSSLAGSDELYDAFFERLGVARAPDMPALLETLKAQTAIGPLRGRRAIVFTCSGGESALSADAAAAAGLELPPLERGDDRDQSRPSCRGTPASATRSTTTRRCGATRSRSRASSPPHSPTGLMWRCW